MMVFSFVQKCRVINEFAANLPFKIGMKTANSHQKYRLKLWIMEVDVSKNGAFYQQQSAMQCNDDFYDIQNQGMTRVTESMSESYFCILYSWVCMEYVILIMAT